MKEEGISRGPKITSVCGFEISRTLRMRTSRYSLQWNRLLIHNFFANSPSASRASLNSEARNTVAASSSRCPGISTAISSQSPRAFFLSSAPSPPPRIAFRPSASSLLAGASAVFSISALTPTMASVPSARQTRALPFVPGRMPVSAVSGRNCVGVRPSARMGGLRERELCR